MIHRKYTEQSKVLQLAYLEACLDHLGMFRAKDLAHLFNQHVKESQRVVKAYREINPDGTESTTRGVFPSSTFKRKILLRSTNSQDFMLILHSLYNVEPLEAL